jgi:hypothetical protein
MNNDIISYKNKRFIALILLVIVIIILILITYIDYNYSSLDTVDETEEIKVTDDDGEEEISFTYIKFAGMSVSFMVDNKQLIFEQAKIGDTTNSGITANIFNDYSFPSPMIDTNIYNNVVNMGLLENDDNVIILSLMKDDSETPNYKLYAANLLKSNLLNTDDEISFYILNNFMPIDTNVNIDSIGKMYNENDTYIGFKSGDDLYKIDNELKIEKLN